MTLNFTAMRRLALAALPGMVKRGYGLLAVAWMTGAIILGSLTLIAPAA